MKSKSLTVLFANNIIQERKLIIMATTITSVSKWMHVQTGKLCKVVGIKEAGSRISEFHIDGHNPLPCYTFKGTYTVLANWLEANGWQKIVKTNVCVPDIVFVNYK